MDFHGWMPESGKLPAMIVGTVVLLFVALFDLAGVQYGLFGMANLLEQGSVPRSNQIFASAGFSTMIGAVLGTSPVIIANESSAGIMEGAKTGLSAIVVAVLFLLSAFITPLLNSIPHVATAVPLVLIGAFMMAPCRGIDWDNLRVAIPSFLTITVVPFTYSIHNGIIAGILMDMFLDYMPKSKEEEIEEERLSKQGTPRRKLSLTPQYPSGTSRRCGATGDTHTPPASPVLTRRFSTPHADMSSIMHTESDKVDSARRLLSDLLLSAPINVDNVKRNPHIVGQQDDERSRQVLVQALEAYLGSHDGQKVEAYL